MSQKEFDKKAGLRDSSPFPGHDRAVSIHNGSPRSPRRRIASTGSTVSTLPDIRRASIEIPLQAKGGSLRFAGRNYLSAYTAFSPAERWRVSLTNKGTTVGRVGYMSTHGTCCYSYDDKGKVSASLAIQEDTSISLGTSRRFHKTDVSTSISSTISNPASSWSTTLSSIHRQDRFLLRGSVGASASISNKAILPRVSFTLLPHTRHRWSIGLGWYRSLLFSLQASPQIDQRRSCTVGVSKQGNAWTLQGSFTQKVASASSQLTLGLLLNLSKGLQWLISWTDGEYTLRVPIEIPWDLSFPITTMSFASIYISFLTQTVHETVSSVFVKSFQASGSKDESVGKRKIDERNSAMQQQALMKRLAQMRVKQESETRGLVIQKASYFVDETDPLDVTIPLQFWVSDSSLELTEVSKMHMLGFCDVTQEKDVDKGEKESVSEGSWISGFWTRSTKPVGESKQKRPQLKVEYQYAGASYEITVQDHERLVLPQ